MDKPKVVTLCGSTRFKEKWAEANLRETLAGNIVMMVGAFTHDDDELELTRHQKAMLDVLHMHKIMLSDEILVLNVDGYVGESTEREIEMAMSIGRNVRWLEPDNIPDQWKNEALWENYPELSGSQSEPSGTATFGLVSSRKPTTQP
jgi:hypothetical protein